jgi:hypothetical protein
MTDQENYLNNFYDRKDRKDQNDCKERKDQNDCKERKDQKNNYLYYLNKLLSNEIINKQLLINSIIEEFGCFVGADIIKDYDKISIISIKNKFNLPIKYIIITNEEFTKKLAIIEDINFKNNKAYNWIKEQNINLKNCKIIKIFITIIIHIIKYKNQIYIFNNDLEDDILLNNDFQNEILKLFLEQTNLSLQDIILENYHYVFTIRSDNLKKFINNKNKYFINDKLQDNIYLQNIFNHNNICVAHNLLNIKTNKLENINNLEELITKLDKLNTKNKKKRKIECNGYKIIYENNNIRQIGEIYIDIYNKLINDIPDSNNIYESFLVLFHNNRLNEVLPYITNYPKEIKIRIENSLYTISHDILNIYHATRKHKNPDLYNKLPESYKKIIYELHNIYITDKKIDILMNHKYKEKISIQTIDVFRYLKTINITLLKQIYYDRNELMNDDICKKFINFSCIYTLTQVKLMNLIKN